MALSYLRLQGFIKQMTKYSEILNYLSGQNGRFHFSSSAIQATSSHSNFDLIQNFEPNSNVNSEIKAASDANPNTDKQRTAYNKKLYKRVLTVSEIEEQKKWEENARQSRLKESDSFGDMWEDKRKNIVRDLNSPKSQKRIFKKSQRNFAKKMFEGSRNDKNDTDTFEKFSDDRSFRPWHRDRPERNTQKMFGGNQNDKNDAKAFGNFSDDRSLRPLLEGVGRPRPVRNAKKMFEGSRNSLNNANTFGKLSDDHSFQPLLEDETGERFLDDESDSKEGRTHLRLSKVRRYREPYWYGKQITQLGKEGKVLEAIDMLEETMLKRDRVMPTTYVFNQLFGILGNVGYTKKAFHLFNKMKKMGLQPDGYTYTCLFNCCSNSPWLDDGLLRTSNLHQLIKDKDITLHPITYKAMVKAYGVCGDIQAAFQAADEMCKLHRPDQQLHSFLLMACVSDTKTGLKHAIQVWTLMRQMNIKPDLPLYNLLLRVIRDSGLGNEDNVKKFPQSRNLHSREITKGYQEPIFEERVTDEEFLMRTKCTASQNTEIIEEKDSNVSDLSTNLFGGTSMNNSVDLSYPENRLAVLGGPMAILQDMKKNGVHPNVLTFTQIIDSLPQDNESELQVLEYMKSENVTRDIDMYNMIIRRRNRRDDYQAANEVLKYIAEDNMFVNLRTFGCLAMGCTTLPKAKKLLQSMDEAGLEPNIEIFGLLGYKSYLDFEYKGALLGMLKKRNIHPNVKFLQHVERSIQSARNKILKIERNETVGNYFKTEKFKNSFANFMINYPKWLKSIGFDKPEHPWKDFRHPKDEREDGQSGISR